MEDNKNMSSSFRTCMKILQALGELCNEKLYDRINVTEICERAGVSRSTFYHHFFGKDDITTWHANIMYDAGVDRIGRSLTWFEGHLITTRGFEPFKHIYYAASDMSNPTGPRTAYVRHRIEVLQDTLVNYQHKELTPLMQFQIEATAVAEANASRQWFAGKSPFDNIKDYCSAMESIPPRELYNALKDPVEDDLHTFFAGPIW